MQAKQLQIHLVECQNADWLTDRKSVCVCVCVVVGGGSGLGRKKGSRLSRPQAADPIPRLLVSHFQGSDSLLRHGEMVVVSMTPLWRWRQSGVKRTTPHTFRPYLTHRRDLALLLLLLLLMLITSNQLARRPFGQTRSLCLCA